MQKGQAPQHGAGTVSWTRNDMNKEGSKKKAPV